MEDVWVLVAGFEGYSVSMDGRVRSDRKGVIMKSHISKRGYFKIGLSVGKAKKTVSVHRLVCAAFHPNPENKPQVNHKDLNQLNNHYKNLEWATAKENTNHAQVNGRIPTKKPFVAAPTFYKHVVNIQTGVVSNTELASKEIGMPRRELARRLNGERYNDTTYRYLGKEDEILIKPEPKLPPKKPIAVFHGDGKLVFDYVQEAAAFANIDRSKINKFIKGECGPIKGFRFKYISEDGSIIEPPVFVPKKRSKKVIVRGPKTQAKKIVQYEKGTMTVIKQYDSIGSVAVFFGASRSTFRKQLNSTGNYKGFVFKYAQ